MATEFVVCFVVRKETEHSFEHIYCYVENLMRLVSFNGLPSTVYPPPRTFLQFWNASCGLARMSRSDFSLSLLSPEIGGLVESISTQGTNESTRERFEDWGASGTNDFAFSGVSKCNSHPSRLKCFMTASTKVHWLSGHVEKTDVTLLDPSCFNLENGEGHWRQVNSIAFYRRLFDEAWSGICAVKP
jgi:hypothetical protein